MIKRTLRTCALGTSLLGAALYGQTASAQGCSVIPPGAMLPDLATVIPEHVQIVNPGTESDKREVLRFSNGLTNIGDGPWRMRPEFPSAGTLDPQTAIQQILDSHDSSGNVLCEELVSTFVYHPTHKHFHINGVALFEVRRSRNTGQIGTADIGGLYVNDRGDAVSVKTTFCLIDFVSLEGNSSSGSSSTRTYFDCAADFQGVSPGWVDVYHQSTDGQQLDITQAPVGLYYLVSTANPDGIFIERDTANNWAWVAFHLTRDSEGNAKIQLSGDSFSLEGRGVDPTYTTNR